VLGVEDWAEIRRLYRSERVSISEIARLLGISRNTVKAALRSDGAPRYERPSSPLLADAFEPRIRELLQAFPTMPATVIAERIGWPHSLRTLSNRVAQLRPFYLPPDPAGRTSYEPGEIAQCDFWFPDIRVPVGFGHHRTPKQLPVLTMVTGYSRWTSAVLIPSRGAEDLFAGWWQLIAALGAVPRVLVWDGEGAIGRWRQRQPELTRECHGFRGTLGAKVLVCKPADPEAKPLIAYCTPSTRFVGGLRSGWSVPGGSVPGGSAGLRSGGRVVGVRRVVEVFAFVVIAVGSDDSGASPLLDGAVADVVGLGDLGEGEQAGRAQALAAAG
jgi:transposase